jgi:GntR family transcriptional regulator
MESDFNPYGQFDIWWAIVAREGLSQGAKLTYSRLTYYAGSDGRCFPAVDTLAADIAVKRRAMQNYLQELDDAGLIKRHPKHDENGRQTSSSVEFIRMPWMPCARVHGCAPSPMHDCAPPRVHERAPKEINHQESKLRRKKNVNGQEHTAIPAKTPEPANAILDDDDQMFPEEKLRLLFEQNRQLLTAKALRNFRELLELQVPPANLHEFVEVLTPMLAPNPAIRSCEAIALKLAQRFRSRTKAARMPQRAPGRCQACGGAGKLGAAYCVCAMGQDLARVEKRQHNGAA